MHQADNDVMRIVLRNPIWNSASEMFVSVGVNTFKAGILCTNLSADF